MSERQYKSFIQKIMAHDAAHDITHIERVVTNAKKMAASENADLDVVVAAAWLHDCVTVKKDSALHSKASAMAAEKAAIFLAELGVNTEQIASISHAIEAHSYSAGIEPLTIEAKIVQDADRIDALGAIGIARCLLVGGSINRSLYSHADPFCITRKPDDTKFCIDHFFVKLFKIADTLHTSSAKLEAASRLKYMQSFLSQLDKETSPTTVN